jgi:hypothetical protein
MIRESTTAILTLPPEIDAGVTVPSGSFGWRWRPGAVLPLVLMVSLATFALVCYLHFGRHVRAYQLMDDPVSYARRSCCSGARRRRFAGSPGYSCEAAMTHASAG